MRTAPAVRLFIALIAASSAAGHARSDETLATAESASADSGDNTAWGVLQHLFGLKPSKKGVIPASSSSSFLQASATGAKGCMGRSKIDCHNTPAMSRRNKCRWDAIGNYCKSVRKDTPDD